MARSKILILEDDKTLSQSLAEALEKKSFDVIMASTADEANGLLNEHKVDYIFADCLLPGMSGDEFVIKLKRDKPDRKFKVILMSGIYTDKSTIQDLLKRTQAFAFLKKPFDLEQIFNIVKEKEEVVKPESPRKMLYQIFSKDMVSTREKRKLIESIEEVSAYDLPFIYSLLTETKSSGYLNIYFNDSSVSGIAFSNGSIVAVDVEDRSTYIGELLIQSGYVSPADIQKALQSKNNQRLGQRLISSNLMSPHALDLTMIEQMNVRLSKTISEKTVKLNFSASEVELTQPSIDSELLLSYLHDWIASKLPINWLKNLYVMWAGHQIIPNAQLKSDHPCIQMSLVQSLDGLYDRLQKRTTLSELLSVSEYNQAALYKALHFLVTKGLIYFSKNVSFDNVDEHFDYLSRLKNQIQNRTDFELLESLGLTQYNDAESAASEIETLLGQEPIKKEAKSFALWYELFNKISTAINSLNPEAKIQLKKAIEKNEAENRIKASQLMDEAKKELMLGQFQSALVKLNEAGKLTSTLFQYNIYIAWSRLGMNMQKKDKAVIKEIEFDLMQIPADERYDFLYPYVMGLYYRATNDYLSAKKSFDKALAMDNTFLAAKRELSLIEQMIKKTRKNDNIFTMDLKDVVTVLFKKK
ncbi:MAG: response regulator [Bdellovibrionaceae bacterium]|nr:response regulator [Pseudobdellovibrionaceae bacterium]